MNLILCTNSQGHLGKGLELLYSFKSDMSLFKSLTSNKVNGEIPTVVMGRKTYESIGRTLPNRVNIVLTRDTKKTIKNTSTISLETFKEITKGRDTSNIWVIGGAEIYKQLIDSVDKVHLTFVSDSQRENDDYIEVKEVLDKLERDFTPKTSSQFQKELNRLDNKEYSHCYIKYDRK